MLLKNCFPNEVYSVLILGLKRSSIVIIKYFSLAITNRVLKSIISIFEDNWSILIKLTSFGCFKSDILKIQIPESI